MNSLILIESDKAGTIINALTDKVRMLEGECYIKEEEIAELKEEIAKLKKEHEAEVTELKKEVDFLHKHIEFIGFPDTDIPEIKVNTEIAEGLGI